MKRLALNLPPRTGTLQTAPRVVCDRCRVSYRPGLTNWACPVCDADAPGAPTSAAGGIGWHDPDTRVVAIVIAATAFNLIVLAILVAIASNS